MDAEPTTQPSTPQTSSQPAADPLTQLALLIQTLLASHAVNVSPQPASPPATGVLPRGVRAPVPETFDGRKTKEVRPWLNRVRDILSMTGFDLNGPDSVRYAATYLTGAAHSWFESERARASYGEEEYAGFGTFKEFADALAQRMGDPQPDDKARAALRKHRQVTSVKLYADQFQQIITHLPQRDALDLRFDFISGLKPKIQELLVGKISEGMTWHDVRDLAYRFDDVIMTSSRDRPVSFSRPRPYGRDPRPDDPMDLSAADTQPSRGRSAFRSATPGRSRSAASAALPRRSPSPSATGLPPLTDKIREELRASNGCFRCRKPNAGHVAANCPGPAAASRSSPSSKN